jgi:hypothetical protein
MSFLADFAKKLAICGARYAKTRSQPSARAFGMLLKRI